MRYGVATFVTDEGIAPAPLGRALEGRGWRKETGPREGGIARGGVADFARISSWPRRVRGRPPPILVGGAGPKTFDRVLEYGDGWMPVFRNGAQELGAQIRELRRR